MQTTSIRIPVRDAPKHGKPRVGDNYDRSDSEWDLPSQTEQYILFVLRGASGVYGLDIQRAFSESSEGQESISVGSLYSLLKRLRRKGLVDSFEGDSIGGGAKRHYYFLTERGETVVKSSENFIRRLREWLPEKNT